MYKNLMLGVFVLFASLLLLTGASAITLSGIPDVSFNEDGSNSSIDLDDYVSNVNGSVTFTYSGNNHVHVSIDANNVVTFTADKDWNGKETITFNATDDNGSDTDDVVVTVNPVNDAPTLSLPSTLKATEEKQFTYDVSKNASDVDGDSLTFSADANGWSTFSMSSSGVISFTPSSADVGLHEVTITVSDGKLNTSKTMTIQVIESCDDDLLVIEDVSVDDITGDDDQTEPGDELELEFDVRNKLTTQKIEDVKVKAWVEDLDGSRVSDKAESEKFDVDEKDKESVDLTLRIDPDVDAGTYNLIIEARGDDEDGNTHCDMYVEKIKVEKSEHSLLIDSVEVIPSTISCGNSFEVSVHIYNNGRKDEDDIKLRFKIADLGIDEYSEEFKLNDGKDVIKTYVLSIPETAKAGDYWLEIIATFNDDEDEATYDLIPLTITCGATTTTSTASSEAVSLPTTTATAGIGETIRFELTLTNTGTSTATYSVSLGDVSSWADGFVEPTVVNVAPGANMPVYVYITPKASGTHTATLSISSGENVIATKTLTINVIGSEQPVTGSASSGIQTTDWGHSKSVTQTKALISDYISTASLILLVALACTFGMLMYVLTNARRKTEIIYEDSKKKARKRRR